MSLCVRSFVRIAFRSLRGSSDFRLQGTETMDAPQRHQREEAYREADQRRDRTFREDSERNLAKVGVVGSNPIARSKNCHDFNSFC